MEWLHRAACRDEDGELWFPVGVSGPAVLQAAEAKAVCRRCPALSACLAYALDNNVEFGIYGGMSEDERNALKRRNARTRQRATAKPKPADTEPPEPRLVMAATAKLTNGVQEGHLQRLHAVGVDGRAACRQARLRLDMAVPAVEVPEEKWCAKSGCRRLFAMAAGVSPAYPLTPDPTAPVLAVGGESVMHDSSSRWHPLDVDGLPACGSLVPRVMRRLAREVEVGRRCRQVRCRRAWAKLDEDLAVTTHG